MNRRKSTRSTRGIPPRRYMFSTPTRVTKARSESDWESDDSPTLVQTPHESGLEGINNTIKNLELRLDKCTQISAALAENYQQPKDNGTASVADTPHGILFNESEGIYASVARSHHGELSQSSGHPRSSLQCIQRRQEPSGSTQPELTTRQTRRIKFDINDSATLSPHQQQERQQIQQVHRLLSQQSPSPHQQQQRQQTQHLHRVSSYLSSQQPSSSCYVPENPSTSSFHQQPYIVDDSDPERSDNSCANSVSEHDWFDNPAYVHQNNDQRNSYRRPSSPSRGATAIPSSLFVNNRYNEGQRRFSDQQFENLNDNNRRQVNLQNDSNVRNQQMDRSQRNISDQQFENLNDNFRRQVNFQNDSDVHNRQMHRYMTRQSVGKDLPRFNGNPDEWLLFFTEYKRTTRTCGFTQDENLSRLSRCLFGPAREAVHALLVMPENVDAIIETLQRRFGRDEYIIKSLISKTKSIAPPKENQPDSIIQFATTVNNLVVTLQNLKRPEYLQNPQLIEDIESKLPPVMLMLWSNSIAFVERYTLLDLSHWIDMQARAMSVRVVPKGFAADSSKSEVKKWNIKDKVYSASVGPIEKKTKCVCCDSSCKILEQCDKFKKLSTDEKWMLVKNSRVCFSCLKRGHGCYKCRLRRKCNVNNCSKKHHPLLHTADHQSTASSSTSEAQHEKEFCTQASSGKSTVLLKIVPVVLRCGNKVFKTGALLDSGSTVTLLRADIADKLKSDGLVQPLCIQWANGSTCTESKSKVVSIYVSGCHMNAKEFALTGVKTVENLPLHRQSVVRSDIVNRWPYLADVPFNEYTDLQPGILIGEDNAFVIAPMKVVQRREDTPVASKTPIGWVISGRRSDKHQTEQTFVYHSCDVTAEMDKLHDLVKKSFSLDDFGGQLKGRSKEDDRAVQIMENTIRKSDQRWEIGLLWRNPEVCLPESKSMALIRLKCLERKLDLNPLMKSAYNNKIQEYVDKKYLIKLNIEPESRLTWFVPHFGVVNPKKPGKLRIVFDAAAKSHGSSLNDFLMPGPDLLQSLPAVLFRFREKRIAFVGDIKEMFHRVSIREADRNSQLILWRGDDRQKRADIYQMTAMTFGASCSPSAAIFVKDWNAKQYISEFPEAAEIIIKNHYVDDCLGCADNEEKAMKLIRDVTWIHQQGGFEIRNWMCNSTAVLDTVPISGRAPQSMEIGNMDAFERVLGVWWTPSTDEFSFRVKFEKIDSNLLLGNCQVTKRQVLQIVMSIYDPLGMLAHFLIKGKIIMQKIWRAGTGWDEPIPVNLSEVWNLWLQELKQIETVKIPRCYSSVFSSSSLFDIQLHIFCDASEQAYCTIAYFRINNGETYETVFVAAKAKVTPLKETTIPRLELQAAVIGARLAATILDEHTVKPGKLFLWSDSKTVLCWIRAERGRFKQYVAQRVGEILERTNVTDWNWISSKENVADDGTRLEKKCDFDAISRWYIGPQFLRTSENEWPQEASSARLEENQEIDICLHQTQRTVWTPDTVRFSKWLRYIRAAAWVLRFCNNIKVAHSDRQRGELTADEIKNAENVCLLDVQRQMFADEIHRLEKDRPLKRSSKLCKLSAFIDNDKVLRVGSRLAHADSDNYWFKYPAILDSGSRFCELLLHYWHEICNHQGDLTVLNEVRQRYWIIGVKRLLKKVKFECRKCRLLKVRPEQQLMGQLPKIRLESGGFPFRYTGVDYFGPMEVVVGRRREKRYGVLFTCMTCRAIHLEIASSLSTDSFIMAWRRFISRRGNPEQMFSDNGTNFRGAETELNRSIKDLDQVVIGSTLANRGIKWSFIPPYSPNFGGCWERLVRSVKIGLEVCLKTKCPTDELLLTLFTEIEQVINSRPLVDVSLNHTDDEAITPNHLLLGRSSASAPLGSFSDADLLLRKKWRASQRMADVFWSKWVKQYLPNLTLRSKWCQRGRKLSKGDVVIIVDSNSARNSWPKGLIERVYPGLDGEVRVADIRTSKGLYRRSVKNICLLEVVGPESQDKSNSKSH